MAPKKVADNKPVYVVLICGLPGSGKTTLRRRLVQNGWAYCSQDELGSAEASEKALIKALKEKKSCVVDRCNVTSSERRLWMQHARQAVEKGDAKGVDLHFEAVWMETPVEDCKRRAQGRKAHETISPENASDVIDKFCSNPRLAKPVKSGQEPYEGVHAVASQKDADVLVNQRFKDPARVDTSMCLAPPAEADHDRDDPVPVAANARAELFILRHGERADRAKFRDDGWVDDPPLTKEGREHAKKAGAALRKLATSPWAPAVYTSPFYRCLQTANEVAAELGLPVRVELGLSELCSARVFPEAAPQLRPPGDSLASALTRVDADLSVAPHCTSVPQWPEPESAAKQRVLGVAQALAARHPGCAVCLVCHGHSLEQITRHLPSSGAGTAASGPGYCALSHIDSGGSLVRSLDQDYLRAQGEPRRQSSAGPSADLLAAGEWRDGWRWLGADDGADEEATDPVDALLGRGLEAALARYPGFRKFFEKGTAKNQEVLRQEWATRDDGLREKLRKGYAAGMFEAAESCRGRGLAEVSQPGRQGALAAARQRGPQPPLDDTGSGGSLFPGPEDKATPLGDQAFEDAFVSIRSELKFPSTAHLKNMGAATRDDKLCDAVRQRQFAGGVHVVSVEEKIDGANLGISLDSKYQWRMQNRAKQVNWETDFQFAGLEKWLAEHSSTLCEVLERNNDILFGEWCAARHSVKYERLPGYFLGFDIYDCRAGKFLSRRSFHTRLQRATGKKIPAVPTVCPPCVFGCIGEVEQLLGNKSLFADEPLEGVYLRLDEVAGAGSSPETYLLDRCKLVRSEFQQCIEDEGTWRGRGKNGIDVVLELTYAEESYPCASQAAEGAAAGAAAAPSAGAAAAEVSQEDVTTEVVGKGNYPSTPHVPFSPGVNLDDTRLADCGQFLRREVIVTEKLDGGNCCIKNGVVYARTHAKPATHESFSVIKQLAQSFPMEHGLELFGENMRGIHSIEYGNLASFFYLFAARRHGQWLSWDQVVDLAAARGLQAAPLVFRGVFSSQQELQGCLEAWARLPSRVGADVTPEGFVVRLPGGFTDAAFADNIGKFVRAGHIQTANDWKRTWKKAELGEALPDQGSFSLQGVSGPEAVVRLAGYPRSSHDQQGYPPDRPSSSSSPPDPAGLAPETADGAGGLPSEFKLWLCTAVEEELPKDDAENLIISVELILEGAADDPDALASAAEVLQGGGAPSCAERLASRWESYAKKAK